MKKEFQLEEINQIAQEVLRLVSRKTLCFYGEMGVGKTTLIKHLVSELGGIDAANSPTFGIVNEYHSKKKGLLGYHFDFYRIQSEDEVYDLGFEDYLASTAWIFIEWPEKVDSILPEKREVVRLRFVDEKTRSIELNP
ncbi:MAG: tRNA (adenosine(37)-N6)-threonylcarbamoyltransferase complex ATPase subunit type 1 TsaE [Bacteroidota bacterium]